MGREDTFAHSYTTSTRPNFRLSLAYSSGSTCTLNSAWSFPSLIAVSHNLTYRQKILVLFNIQEADIKPYSYTFEQIYIKLLYSINSEKCGGIWQNPIPNWKDNYYSCKLWSQAKYQLKLDWDSKYIYLVSSL